MPDAHRWGPRAGWEEGPELVWWLGPRPSAHAWSLPRACPWRRVRLPALPSRLRELWRSALHGPWGASHAPQRLVLRRSEWTA